MFHVHCANALDTTDFEFSYIPCIGTLPGCTTLSDAFSEFDFLWVRGPGRRLAWCEVPARTGLHAPGET